MEAGHEIPIERPRETAALIEAFVAGLGTSEHREAGAPLEALGRDT